MPHKIDDGLTLRRNSDLALNLSPSSGMHRKANPLTSRKMFQGCHNIVFSDSTAHLSRGVFRCGGNSPPPPALSPASSSPEHLVSNAQTRVSSPSPPVIDAEITENSSESSRAVYDKEMSLLGSEAEMSTFCHQNITPPYACLSIKSHPRIPASTSSSSSTTSASSSTAAGSTDHLKNSLPILEKISIVMGSPGGSCGQPVPPVRPDDAGISFNQQDQLGTQASVTLIPIDAQPDNATKSGVPHDDIICTDNNLLSAMTTVDKPRITGTSNGSARGRGRTAVRSRRRVKSRQKAFAFSDDDVEDTARTRAPRGKTGVSTILRRVRQNAGHKRIHSASGGPLESCSTNPEAAVARRYLESPFFCLCQSGGNSGELNTAYEAFYQNRTNCANSAFPSNSTLESGSNFISDVSSTRLLPAHLISPALLHGSVVSGAGNGSQLSLSANHPCTFPPTCPFTPCGHQNRFGEHDPLLTSQGPSDSKNIFVGLTYRPVLAARLLSCATLDNQTSWCCAFCGNGNSMSVELGNLYGPYWLTANEISQLPLHLVTTDTGNATGDSIISRPTASAGCKTPAIHSQPLNSVCSDRPVTSTTCSSVRSAVGAGGRCQNVTRSNSRRLAPINSQTTAIPAVGSLRLVIKAPNTKRPKAVTVSLPASRKQSVKTNLVRVGVNGEVWLHLECVLWAPGTYLRGNGTIGGLGEALQLALDVTCSYCDKPGAVLSCCYRGCNLSYHYQCSLKAGCHLDLDQYTLVCRKHHVYP